MIQPKIAINGRIIIAKSFVPSRGLSELRDERVVAGSVDEGPVRQYGHASLDGGSSRDGMVSTSPSGLSAGPSPRRAGPPRAAPAPVVRRGSCRPQRVLLVVGVPRFLEGEDGRGMDLGKVMKGRHVGVQARAVQTDEGHRPRTVSVSRAGVSAPSAPVAPRSATRVPGG